MLTREMLEEREDEYLAPYAMRSSKVEVAPIQRKNIPIAQPISVTVTALSTRRPFAVSNIRPRSLSIRKAITIATG